MNDSRRGSGSAAPTGVVIGPDAGFIGIGCIAVATAQVLGVHWLREPVLGIPAGIWLVALGWGLLRVFRGRMAIRAVPGELDLEVAAAVQPEHPEAIEQSAPDQSGQLRFPFGGSDARTSPALAGTYDGNHLRNSGTLLRQSGYRLAEVEAELPATPGPGARLVLGGAGAVLSIGRLMAASSDRSSEPSRFWGRVAAWHDTVPWPTRPFRVGVDLCSDQAALLIRAGVGLGIEWIPVPVGGDDQRECAARALDGIVRMDATGDTRFCSAEHPSREAGWYDWSRPMPLSYSAVFPTRVDPCLVTLSRGWGFERADVRVIARLIHAAAVFSRCGVRLGVADRLRGRRPIDLGDATSPAALLQSGALAVGAVSGLTESICTELSADPMPLKAAARVVGAWAATTDVPVDPEVRREAAEAALRILPGEPEAILRAVATRFAAYDDDAAFDGVRDAARAIRAVEHGPILDPVAFLEAEIELGLPGPMTFGRVAAGLCMVAATADDARVDYVCDDLADEMRYSGWLIGRDSDRRVLIEVMRTVQRARRDDPAREAA